ncbi:acid protease [Amanita muscaria]
MPLVSLTLSSLLFAIAVNANPVILDQATVAVPITRITQMEGIRNVVQLDRARASYLNARGTDQSFAQDPHPNEEPIFNGMDIYLAQVAVGTPPTSYSLIVDTGSSNTWVGANKSNPYNVFSETSKYTFNAVNVNYGSGSFAGNEFDDQVSFGSFSIDQSIGAAAAARGFRGVDGILGLGPTNLTKGTLKPDIEKAIPTVVDNAVSQGIIGSPLLSAYLEPNQANHQGNGVLTFGALDNTNRAGEVIYAPITQTLPAGAYWGINQTTSYGSHKIVNNGAGIVDTGTTLLLLDEPSFQVYQQATGGTLDSKTGLLTISKSQYEQLLPLIFQIGDHTIQLSPNGQIWPRFQNTAIGGEQDKIYLAVASADLGELGFILGFTFLQRYLTVYDSEARRVGFAATRFTFSNIN